MQVKHVESAGENPLLARVQIHPSSSRALHTHTHTHTQREQCCVQLSVSGLLPRIGRDSQMLFMRS